MVCPFPAHLAPRPSIRPLTTTPCVNQPHKRRQAPISCGQEPRNRLEGRTLGILLPRVAHLQKAAPPTRTGHQPYRGAPPRRRDRGAAPAARRWKAGASQHLGTLTARHLGTIERKGRKGSLLDTADSSPIAGPESAPKASCHHALGIRCPRVDLTEKATHLIGHPHQPIGHTLETRQIGPHQPIGTPHKATPWRLSHHRDAHQRHGPPMGHLDIGLGETGERDRRRQCACLVGRKVPPKKGQLPDAHLYPLFHFDSLSWVPRPFAKMAKCCDKLAKRL